MVVDSDVLWRNIEYAVVRGWSPALLCAASPSYSFSTGVVLCATSLVFEETERHLPEIAERLGVPLGEVVRAWNDIFVPRIRIVDVTGLKLDDGRIEAVAELHEDDAPTAALVALLAPCLLLTDNRRHFRPLQPSDRATTEIALDADALTSFIGELNAAVTLPALVGDVMIRGSTKAVAALGVELTCLVGVVLLGATVLLWQSEGGGRLCRSVAALAREAGPPIAEHVAQQLSISRRLFALAIEPEGTSTAALSYISRALVCESSEMSTAEVAAKLRGAGYRFSNQGRFRTNTRSWLAGHDCFVEFGRGHWTFGYHATDLPPVTDGEPA